MAGGTLVEDPIYASQWISLKELVCNLLLHSMEFKVGSYTPSFVGL